MKITCERCSAQYDLDENRIPPSGMTMKCPACLHQFTVRRGGSTAAAPPPPPPIALAPPPKKREIELSTYGDDEGPTPLPDAAPGMVAPDPDEIDLPAPKDHFTPDLPAPKAPSRRVAIAPPKSPSIPAMAPVRKPPPLPIEPERTRDDGMMSISREMGPGPDEIDLPAPVDVSGRDIIDLPAPRSMGASPSRPIELMDEDSDLLAPKDRLPQVGISLDAPDSDDMPSTPRLGSLDRDDDDDGAGPPALDLDNIDVVAPKLDVPELPAPRTETTDVAPRAETHDVAFKGPSIPPPLPARSEPPLTAVAKAKIAKDARDAKTATAEAEAEAAKPPRRRWGRTLAAVAGLLLLLGGVGVALGVFTGVGRELLHGKPDADLEQKLMSARKQMADDTTASYRTAVLGLGSLLEGDSPSSEAAALAAQARLGLARLGQTSELKNADTLLAKLAGDEKAQQMPDLFKARALRSTVGGNWNDARTKLNLVLAKAPADAAALVYLGWTELGAGDAAAADKAFAKALASEPTRAAALYGDGVAKERLGDVAAAHDLYARALSRSPSHFGAAVGEARTGPKARESGNEVQAQVAELIEKRSAVAAPKELADAWATVGMLAAREGRRDEAEDRLKRALALDADNVAARVALARVQCDLAKCADAIAPLQKLLAAQPKNLDARLALARAQMETGSLEDANTTMAPVIKDAATNPEALFLRGRMILASPRADKEQAIARFKEAIAADPKFIPAYVAESNTFAALDRADEAVGVLQQAQQQAADSPELMIQLGEAYLTLGKPIDAEARFRAALEKNPEARAARIDLGAALEAQNKLDEARAQYDRVAGEDAKFPGLLERQARLAVRQNRKADAAKLFDEALKQGVPTQSLRLAAGAFYLDPTIARPDDARKLAESVIKEDERSAQAHLLLARMQLEAGRPEEALPEARRAATLADLPEAHLTLGRVLEAMSKLDQAIAEYNLARRPPVEGEAQLGRARILVRMGATKDALAELAALAKDPKLRAPALLLAGDCYADLQQGDRARHSYEDAVRAAPESGDAAFKLGRAFHDSGRRRDAIVQLERAIKLGGDKIRWAADAQLILGDAHREGKENDAAIKAYKRYLELAPADAPARVEVQKQITILGGG
ncbi:MAG: Tetratricopeptide 2 repeat protein [Myxococcales bacterium]|nr:Tetratricopeptide 2 repeat protein [Myxococcales bacterium]